MATSTLQAIFGITLIFLSGYSCQDELDLQPDLTAVDDQLAVELQNAISSITDRVQSTLIETQNALQKNMEQMMSQMGSPQLDFGNIEPGQPGQEFPNIPFNLPKELINNIVDSLKPTLTQIIDEAIDKKLSNISADNSDILAAINTLDGNYDKLYKKLFEYTRSQISTLESKLLSFNVTDVRNASDRDTTSLKKEPVVEQKIPSDCAEAKLQGKPTGVTLIHIESMDLDQKVWCDQDTDGGGWTVFLRRIPNPGNQLEFKKDRDEYREFFGEPDQEYWLGLEALHQMTSNNGKNYELRVDIKKDTEEAFSKFKTFRVGPSYYYELEVGGYLPESTAGDAMEYHNGMRFSTHESDNDRASGGSCSQWSGGGGWWYNYCYYSNPTGIYPPNDLPEDAEADHFLEWRKWQGYFIYLTHLDMKIRPK